MIDIIIQEKNISKAMILTMRSKDLKTLKKKKVKRHVFQNGEINF